MEEGDLCLSADKFQHLLACFLITLLVAFLARRSRHPFLRRRSAALGSLAALAAGAAKEASDEIGLWNSTGVSAKDAAAHLLGVVVASPFLALLPSFRREPDPDPDPRISMV